LRDIQIFNPAGFVSFGLPIGDVPSFKRGVPAVVSGIGRDLFLDDLDIHEKRMNADIAPDFSEDLYASAIWKGASLVAAD
jgi:FAD-dependent urate hydroxylase